MRRLIIICLLALSAVALPVSSASAAKGPKPVITKVSPMRVSVGKLLTIYGRSFKSGVKGNTVIFRASNGRTVFGKPVRASRTKLVVRVPTGASRLLDLENSQQKPTRLKLRALAGKFSAFTTRRLSPVVVPNATGEGCERRADFDSDLLTNQEELDTTKTDPCNPDTDADGIIDGWEFWSAKDLNIKAVPYPGKRPFPNPLDPSDGLSSIVDFDGDGLTTGEEFRAWKVSGSSFDRSNLSKGPSPPDHESVLGYSDGTQASRPNETPRVPNFRSGSIPGYGLPNPPYDFPAFYDFEAGAWWDFERDADADGLNNFIESSRGPGQASWWAGFLGQESIQFPAWPKFKDGCGDQEAGDFTPRRPFASLDLGDSDVDGDSLLDGEDDQDNDDYINVVELYETQKDVDGDGNVAGALNDEDPPVFVACIARSMPTMYFGGQRGRIVNAFNPCAPNPRSRTCPYYKPFN